MLLPFSEEVLGTRTYSPNVASRHFKSPELLLEYDHYNQSIDIWSGGCLFAGLIFGDEPFFTGSSNIEELASIASVVGSDEITSWVEECKIKLTPLQRVVVSGKSKIPFSEYHTAKYSSICSPEAIDLLSKMLVVDPKKRFTAEECINHKYFDDIR